jgi:ankyrin repeat protein
MEDPHFLSVCDDIKVRDALHSSKMNESKAVFDLCGVSDDANFGVLKAYLEEHPEVKVDLYRNVHGYTALLRTSHRRSPKSTELLLDRKADINARTHGAYTSLMLACRYRGNDTSLILLERGADIHLKNRFNQDALNHCVARRYKLSTSFLLLCCGLDVRLFNTNTQANRPKLNACIAEYKQTHAFIDVYHSSLLRILSTEVPADTRIGLREYGIYHEPLERVLDYCGLSMHADQVVNDSIDRKTKLRTVKRALIPGQARNAMYWYDLYKKNN